MNSNLFKQTYKSPKKVIDFNKLNLMATKISDIWEEEHSLILELGLNNLQKSYLQITNIDNESLNIFFSRKKRLHFKKFEIEELSKKKRSIPTYKKTKQAIEIKLKNKLFKFYLNSFNIEIVDKKTNSIIFTLLNRDGLEVLNNKTSIPLGFQTDKDYKSESPIVSVDLQPSENIYGLGEIFNSVEKSGIIKNTYNSDPSGNTNMNVTYNSLPLVYSTNNWGFFLNSAFDTTFDIRNSLSDGLVVLANGEYLDINFLVGNSINDLISSYTKLTGRIQGIPDASYGIAYSKCYYYNKKEVDKIIKKAKDNKLQIDMIHIDPKWIEGRYTKTCSFEVSKNNFYPLDEYFSKLKSQGIFSSFWINPYIQVDDSKTYKYLKDNNMLLLAKDSIASAYTGLETNQKNTRVLDLSNKKTFNWLKYNIIDLYKQGLDFILPDYGDGAPDFAIYNNGVDGKEMHNWFLYLYSKASYEAGVEYFGKGNSLAISRPGYIGTHAFPGKWGGDSRSRWQELDNSIKAFISISMAGETFWGSDIGGFMGIPTNELYIRWLEFGAFTPYTRMHGLSDREPWHFGNESIKAAKILFEIKKKWIPNYKLLEYEATKTGIAPARAMVQNYQNDLFSRKIDSQFMYGNNIIIAPITNPNQDTKQVYLPQGLWFDYWNNSKVQGNYNSHIHTSKLGQTPVYIKENSILLTFESGDYKLTDISNQTLIINAFFGKETGSFKGSLELKLGNKKVKIIYDFVTKKEVQVIGYKKYKLKIIK